MEPRSIEVEYFANTCNGLFLEYVHLCKYMSHVPEENPCD